MRSKTHDDVVAEEVIGEEARTIDPEVERRVVRKIDMFLISCRTSTTMLSQD